MNNKIKLFVLSDLFKNNTDNTININPTTKYPVLFTCIILILSIFPK